jgi:hypothetical protein
MPAISNDVPIGYLMKGEEMLSFMRPATPEDGGRIFSRRSGIVPGSSPGAKVRFRRLLSGGSRTPGIRDRLLTGSIIAPGVIARMETFAGVFDLRPIGDRSDTRLGIG